MHQSPVSLHLLVSKSSKGQADGGYSSYSLLINVSSALYTKATARSLLMTSTRVRQAWVKLGREVANRSRCNGASELKQSEAWCRNWRLLILEPQGFFIGQRGSSRQMSSSLSDLSLAAVRSLKRPQQVQLIASVLSKCHDANWSSSSRRGRRRGRGRRRLKLVPFYTSKPNAGTCIISEPSYLAQWHPIPTLYDLVFGAHHQSFRQMHSLVWLTFSSWLSLFHLLITKPKASTFP